MIRVITAAFIALWASCTQAQEIAPPTCSVSGQTITCPNGSVTAGSGTGTVTSVSVTTANGVSGTVATATTTPAISLTLGAITPSSAAIGAGSAITSSGAGGSLSALAYTTPGTGVATALGVNIGSAGAPVLFNGAGGTPSSLTGTNISGTAAGLTAGTVTTNANLTGPITSAGNATSIASQTGTGTKFVVDTSPTLVTPNIGVATGTSLALNGATLGSNAVAGIGQFASFGATTTGPGFYSYLTGDTVARVRVGLDANDMPSLAFGGGATTRDTFILRIGAGVIQYGTSDVDTAPVAQTSRSQGTLAGGTSDVAGANWTFIASPGKGTGVGGSFIFQTAPAGSTGTVVNAPVTALTLSSAGRATIAGGITNSGNGAASLSNSLWSGTIFTGGSGTTNFPAMFVQPNGTTAATTWSTSGTGLGMNLASGFAGNFIDLHVAGGASLFSVTSAGSVTGASFVPTGSTVPTNGMYLSAANQLSLATNTSVRMTINSAGVVSVSPNWGTNLVNNNAAGFQLSNGAASATAPTFAPNRADTTTGIGAQASGNISLIAGAVEIARVTSTAFTQIIGQTVLKGYTVSTLPAGITGGNAFVTDAVACTFLATVTGGGSAFCPVIYNGTSWVGA